MIRCYEYGLEVGFSEMSKHEQTEWLLATLVETADGAESLDYGALRPSAPKTHEVLETL